jgi:phosphoheptose isomerase
MIESCYTRGGKVLICGNGGSAADAQHFAGELVGRFKISERPGLPALALSADTAVLTAWSNDASFDDIFARQVQAFGRPGDVLVSISTSGRARNVVNGMAAAQREGLRTIALLGGDGGDARALADLPIVVPAKDTQRVQEVQILVIHLLCELVEERLFGARPLMTGGTAQMIEALPANVRSLASPDGHGRRRLGRVGQGRRHHDGRA